MTSRHRWLWPCSDSHVLRLPAYQKPTLHACLIHPDRPEDILVSDSDDDLENARHTARRRRIEAIAHSFLNGQPIYIPSARLKGPFPIDRDLSACHIPDSSPADRDDSVSPISETSPLAQPALSSPAITAHSFIRRRPDRPRPKSLTPEPTNTPSKPQLSSPARQDRLTSRQRSSRQPSRSTGHKLLRFDLPSSVNSVASTQLPPLSKFVAINTQHLQHGDIPVRPDSATPSHPPPSSTALVPDSTFISPSPSPTKHAEPTPSPTKSTSVLRQRPASSLNQPTSSLLRSHKLLSVKKNKPPVRRIYQATATSDTTSPFIYRKNAHQPRRSTVPAKTPPTDHDTVIHDLKSSGKIAQTLISPEEPHLVPSESSPTMLQHSPQPTINAEHSSGPPQHDIVPAINMSFGQESLGMDFNTLNHFDNPSTADDRRLTAPGVVCCRETERTHEASGNPNPTANASSSNNADLRDIDAYGVRFEGHVEDEFVRNTATVRDQQDPGFMTGVTLVDPEGETEDRDSMVEGDNEDVFLDDPPYVSTQAAMQDAHRALFDASSPLQLRESTPDMQLETPAKQAISSPSSPVHAITPFHEFNAELTTDALPPLPNTQALFDGFYSPLKLSIKKPSVARRSSFAPLVAPEDVDDSVMLGVSAEQAELDQNNHNTTNDQPQSSAHKSTNLTPSQALRSHLSAHFQADASPVRNVAVRSDSPDFILSQKTSGWIQGSQGPILPVLQQDLVSLSDIFKSVSSQRGVDVNSLLSQGTPASSNKFKSKKRKSALSSQSKPRSSQAKSCSFQMKPRSSLPRSLTERKSGGRRSLRLSLSQPNFQAEDGFDTEVEVDMPTLSQPLAGFRPFDRSFASLSSTVPGVSSTIPDPSLALDHVQQAVTPVSGKPAITPGSVSTSTGFMSSFQPAQKQHSSLTDLDSTTEDLQQTFFQPVR